MSVVAFPPVLLAMAKDRRLRPTDIQVFIVASQYLDFVEFRPLKVFGLAHELRTSHSQAAYAVRRLVGCGYLERGEREIDRVAGAGAFLFRIPYSVRVPVRQPSGVDKTNTT